MEYINEKLNSFNNYISKSKVGIIGLGTSNIPLIDYFYELKNSNVTIFDQRDAENIDKELLEKIVKYGMTISLGKDNLNNLKGFDIIFRSPSCLPNTPELIEEAKRGAIITTEVEMVIELTPSTVIGVTGSDGKTTTTTLISEILKADRKNVFLGGNIGTPLFTKIKDMRPDDFVVLELSSFQLMNMKISPKISVITNITPNHLNIHTDMAEYINAKKAIFESQESDDILILNNDNAITKLFESEAKGKVILFSSKEKLNNGYIYDADDGKIKYCENGLRMHVFDTRNMLLRGVHNFENACCAIAATKTLISNPSSVQKVLSEFKGVEHRLELVKETKTRIKWYNDSVSSSPTRTIAGLNAFSLKNIILIAGGYDKNLDYTSIAKPIIENCKSLILLGQTADKIEQAVNVELKKSNNNLKIYRCNTLKDTVELANKISVKGDIVLFSPASASFDMFKNFAERGNIFKEYVNEIVKE